MQNIDFVGKRRIFMTVSAVLVLAFVIISFTKGFDVGVEYSGGTELTFSINEKMNSSDIRDNLAKVKSDYVSAKIVELKSPAEKQDRHFYQIVVKDSLPTTEEKEIFISSLQNAFDGKDLQKEGLNDVSGAAAVELKSFAWYAVILVIISLLLYITLRFKFAFAAGAILALTHDILITLGCYSLFNIEMNAAALASLLTLAGYGLNDTVVIFDRIRENSKKYRGMPIDQVVNKSINEMFTRTIITALTTFIVVFTMLVWGGKAIAPFAFGMTIGTAVSAYSTIYIASAVVISVGKKKKV